MIEERKSIPVAEDVVEFIKRGTESEQIALENLKTIAPAIKKQMTEQEKREKATQEMAKAIMKNFNKLGVFNPLWFADAIYDNGYRKEEEVIKELLRTTIFPIIREGYTNKETIEDVIKKTIKAHYGVEV